MAGGVFDFRTFKTAIMTYANTENVEGDPEVIMDWLPTVFCPTSEQHRDMSHQILTTRYTFNDNLLTMGKIKLY